MVFFDILFWSAAVFVACTFGPATIDAAEIRVDPSRAASAGVVLEGKIEPGDFDKVANFILKGENAVEIYLASPGGDLAEALKIGLLVRMLKLSTVVPSKALTNQARNLAVARRGLKDPKADDMCASACFFVFVAGIHRSSDNLGPAVLGMHRPYMSEKDLKRLNFDQVSAVDHRTRTVVANYLKAMGVPAKYAENMYTVPKDSIRWIRNDEFQADFGGFIPELRDWVDNRCDNRTDDERKNSKDNTSVEQTTAERSMSDMSKKKNEARLRCERKLQDELALRAYGEALKRRHGEIPQSTSDRILPPLPK
jgi:hypothetical protein